MEIFQPILDAAKGFGSIPYAATLLAVFAVWALREILKLRTQLQQLEAERITSVIDTITKLEAAKEIAPDISHRIQSSVLNRIDPNHPSDTRLRFKLLGSYISGMAVTAIRYVVAYLAPGPTDSFQIPFLAAHKAYVIGIIFIPVSSTIATIAFLDMRDPMKLFVIFGGVFSVLIPLTITAFTSLADVSF